MVDDVWSPSGWKKFEVGKTHSAKRHPASQRRIILHTLDDDPCVSVLTKLLGLLTVLFPAVGVNFWIAAKAFPKIALMNSNGELRRPALLRGHGHARICTVCTCKNCIPPGSGWSQLFGTPTKILDGKDNFEDGIYELVLGAQVFSLIKNGGEYKEITAIRSKAVVSAS